MLTAVTELCGIAGVLRGLSVKDEAVKDHAYLFEMLGMYADELATRLEGNDDIDAIIADLDELGGVLLWAASWQELEGKVAFLCRRIAGRCNFLATKLDIKSLT
jgi:hypothetical protein